jgi:HPt (histidine-containing phosphotransfer) domain-containing protein
MDKKISELPIIDSHINKAFAKNSNKILKELLNLFIEEAPKLQSEINLAFQKKQKNKLEDLLHKLKGSCSYCGWIRLKAVVNLLERSTSQSNYNKDLLDQFNRELKASLDTARKITQVKTEI